MSDLREWVTMELWTCEDGSIGWKVSDHLNESIKLDDLQTAMLEATEWTLDPREENPVVFSHITHANGFTHSRQSWEYDFSPLRRYLSVKLNFRRSHWLAMGRSVGKNYLLIGLWSVEWLYHRLLGHFKPHQKAVVAAATPTGCTAVEVLRDGLSVPMTGENAANVVPFKPVRKADDQRPL